MNLATKRELANALDLIECIKSVPRWQRDAERRLAKKMAGIMAKATAAVIRELELRGVPSDPIRQAALLDHLVKIEGDMGQAVLDEVDTAGEHGANRVIDSLRKQGVRISQPQERMQAVIDRLREHALERTQRSFSGTREDIRARLADLYERGIRGDDAVKDLREYMDGLESWDIRRLARTEINSAQSEAADITMHDYGAQYKRWESAGDDGRTRESHLDLDGQITAIDDPFISELTGLRIMRPHDPGADVSEIVNCRCREVPFIMPRGYIAPPGKDYFYENEIVKA